MRSAGAVLVIIGVLFAYLGWTGKLKPAFAALRTGQAPAPTTNSGSGTGAGSAVKQAVTAQPLTPAQNAQLNKAQGSNPFIRALENGFGLWKVFG